MSELYPNRCRKCHSPARKIGAVVLCSKLKCRTRGKAIRSFGEYGKWVEGDSLEHPIIVICPVCLVNSDGLADGGGGYCYGAHIGRSFPFKFEAGKYYVLCGKTYIWDGRSFSRMN